MAAANIHLEIKEIEGDSEVDKFEKQIDCHSWNWGCSQAANMHTATGGSSGACMVQDISVSKTMDKASPNLAQYCMNGTHLPTAILHCTKSAGDTGRIEWYTITMSEVIISSVSQSGHGGGDMGDEQVSLNFAKVQVQYFEQDDKGGSKPGPDVTYNIRKALQE